MPLPGRPTPHVRSSLAELGGPVAEAHEAASGGDVARLVDVVASVGRDGDVRDLCFAAAAEHPDGRWADRWAEASGSADALVALAAVEAARAWRARGSGRGAELDDGQVDGWFACLERVEEAAGRAADLDDADPTPWAYLLLSARGLQLEDDERDARFAQLRRRDPHHRHGCRQALRGASSQWSGSSERMFDMVDTVTADAPPGSTAHALWPEAHVEAWRWLVMQDPPDERAHARYWQDPAVQAVCAEAFRRLTAAPPLQPARLVEDAGLFAFAFAHTGDVERAAAAFALTEGTAVEEPWAYAGEPLQAYRDARRWSRA